MFRAADLVVLNKSDLLPHVPFDLVEWQRLVGGINSRATLIIASALSGDGMAEWIAEIAARRACAYPPEAVA
jgi:hydrogenase nickel incorporation protein HypB